MQRTECNQRSESRPIMKATTNAQTALDLLRQEHRATQALIDQLTDAQMTAPDTIRYGLYPDDCWSFRDLLAHMTAYERHALDAVEAFENGEHHPILNRVLTQGYAVHTASVADRAEMSLSETITEYQDNAAALESLIADASPDQWQAVAPFAADTDYGGVIEQLLVLPPRPLYRHLPVHIPNPDAYLRQMRG